MLDRIRNMLGLSTASSRRVADTGPATIRVEFPFGERGVPRHEELTLVTAPEMQPGALNA